MQTNKLLLLLSLLACQWTLHGQKMLLLERKNSPKTTKYYIGDRLTYQYRNDEQWYTSTISDMQVDHKSVMLDQLAVPIDSIGAFRVPKKPLTRLGGGALFTLGATLTFASTIAILYGEKDYDYAKLYGGAAVSGVTGYFLLRPRKVKMGERFRLRVVEVRF